MGITPKGLLGSAAAADGGGASARVEQIACDDIAAVGTATHINPQGGDGGPVSVVYGEGDPELVTATTDAANNGLVTLAAGLHYIEVTGEFQGSAASVGAEVRLKRWRDGSDEANDPVLAVETVSLPVSATDHRDSVPLSVWLAAETQVYFELEELGSTATIQVDDPKITVIRWGGAAGAKGGKGDKGDAGSDAADFTRAEKITFDAVTSGVAANNEMTPRTTNPIEVVSGSGDPEILSGVSGNDFTIKAGLYLVKFQGQIDCNQNNQNPQGQIRRASNNAVQFSSTKPAMRSGDDQSISLFAVYFHASDLEVNINLAFPDSSAQSIDALNVLFIRWGGGEGSGGAAFSIHDLADELVDYVAAGGPTGALGASDLAAVSDESAAGDPNKKITAENLGRELVRILANHTTPVSHLALTDRVPFADQNFNWRGGVVDASQFRDMVFENPPSGLSDAQKTALRTAMDAAAAFEIALLAPATIADADQIAFADDDDDSNKRESALDFANFVLGKRPKAANTDVDAIASTGTAISTSLADPSALDDADYLTVRKFVRGLARVVKTANTTMRGVVLLARAEDVAATETDTSRVTTVANVKALIARLASASAAGASITYGAAPPDDANGADGDLYIRTGASAGLYTKASGSWGLRASLSSGGAAFLVSGLTAITSLQDDDQAAIADNSDSDGNKKVALSILASYVLGKFAATDFPDGSAARQGWFWSGTAWALRTIGLSDIPAGAATAGQGIQRNSVNNAWEYVTLVTETRVGALITAALATYSTTAQMTTAIAAAVANRLQSSDVKTWALSANASMTVPDNQIPASIARDTEVTGAVAPAYGRTASIVGQTLTLPRVGGANPTELTLPGAGTDTFETEDYGIWRHAWDGADNAALGLTNTDGTDTTHTATNGNIICPTTGWVRLVVTADENGYDGDVFDFLAEDLRAARAEDGEGFGFYTDGTTGQIFLDTGGAGTAGNIEVLVFHYGSTRDSSGIPTRRIPHILRFDVTGDAQLEAGAIGGTEYSYHSQISQSGHVAAARVVFFLGTANDPPSVSVLDTLTTAEYPEARGTVQLPATAATAGQTYTIRLEVYESGQTAGTDAPVAYHDFRISIVAAALHTHFGAVRYPSSYDPFDSDTFPTAAQIAAVIPDNFTTAGRYVELDDRATLAGDYTLGAADIPTTGSPDYWALVWAVPDGGTISGIESNSFAVSLETVVVEDVNGANYNVYITEIDSPAGAAGLNGQTFTVSD